MKHLSKGIWKEVLRDLNKEFFDQKLIWFVLYAIGPIAIFIAILVSLNMSNHVRIILSIVLSVISISNTVLFILEKKYFSWIKEKKEIFLKIEKEKLFQTFKENKIIFDDEKEALLSVRRALINLNPVHINLDIEFVRDTVSKKIKKLDVLYDKEIERENIDEKKYSYVTPHVIKEIEKEDAKKKLNKKIINIKSLKWLLGEKLKFFTT